MYGKFSGAEKHSRKKGSFNLGNFREEKKTVREKAFLLPHLMFVTHAPQFFAISLTFGFVFLSLLEWKDKFFKLAHAKMTKCPKKAAKWSEKLAPLKFWWFCRNLPHIWLCLGTIDVFLGMTRYAALLWRK